MSLLTHGFCLFRGIKVRGLQETWHVGEV